MTDYSPRAMAEQISAEIGRTVTAKQVRAQMRKAVRAEGGVIGKDTPGRGKRYALDARAFRSVKANVTRALSASDAAEAAEQE